MAIRLRILATAFCLTALTLSGCGSAPLASIGAKWFDYTDPENATPIAPSVSKAGLAKVGALKLDFGGNPKLTDADLEAIKGMGNLVHLDLYETSISDAALEHVRSLPKLEVLDVSQTSIGDAGLEKIGGMTSLKRLELYKSKVTDAGMKHLGKLTLMRIDLSETAVTDLGMSDVAKIAGLQRLHLRGTKITEKGLEVIGKMEDLQELGLYQVAGITDAGLKHLHNLKQLKALFLGESAYTPEGLAELRKALPRCDIAGND